MRRSDVLLWLLWPFHALAILPILAAAGGAAAIGGLVGGLLTNKKTKGIRPVNVDRSNYLYGGSEGYADQRRQQLQARGEYARGRDVLGGYDTGDYTSALASSRQAREQQQGLVRTLQDAVAGRGPSAAELQMNAGTAQAAKNALNVAASARGGNYAGAAAAAQGANAMGAQQAVQDAAVLRAQEQAQARAELGGVLGNIRQADLDTAQGSGAMALQQQGLSLEQMRQNDAYEQAQLQGELAINQGQLQGSMGYGDAQLQSGLAAQGLQYNAQEAYRNRMNALWGGLMGAGGAIGASALGGKLCR